MANAKYTLLGGPFEGLSCTISDSLSTIMRTTDDGKHHNYVRIKYHTMSTLKRSVVELFIHKNTYDDPEFGTESCTDALARVAGKVIK